ncbi:MAG: transposase [Chloroflexales bacterium]|nr:transposase [Chloroflexales bacterium]
MQRTIRIRLQPSPAQSAALGETSRQYTAAFNLFAELGWRSSVSNATKLHYLAYYPVRTALPALNSNLVNTARAQAAEALKSAVSLRTDPPRTVSQPRSTACPPWYNQHTYRIDWESQTVRLSLVGGRQTLRFSVPPYAVRYAGNPADTADVIERNGVWWLHVVVTVPGPEIEPTDQVVGVDLGLAQPAVGSNHRFDGKQAWKAIEGRLFKHKRALQKQGTKSAKRRLKKLRRKQARFRRDGDHALSKQIVQSVEPGATMVVENLTTIRKRATAKKKTAPQRRLHAWSFAQLKTFLAYKAEERGCTAGVVDPRHTSQTCRCCGHTARNNRRSRAVFRCRACGYDRAEPAASHATFVAVVRRGSQRLQPCAVDAQKETLR